MKLTALVNDYMAKNIADCIRCLSAEVLDSAEEIRIRVGQPLYLRCGQKEVYPDENGYIPTLKDIDITINKMSNYSVYAFNEELKKGYLTLPGGYRVGICGTVVYTDTGIVTIKNISSVNIRISHEVKGCADKVINILYGDGRFLSTLIISPPACGKTTLLRDIIRQLSNSGLSVGVVDERSEIGGTYMGQAQNDLGSHTDILDGCKKDEGMYMLLRSMAPIVIAVDEIGSQSELDCIRHIVNSGVGLLCTVHAANSSELMQRPGFKQLTEDRLFKRYILLSSKPSVGTVQSVMDEELGEICF